MSIMSKSGVLWVVEGRKDSADAWQMLEFCPSRSYARKMQICERRWYSFTRVVKYVRTEG